MKNRSAITAIGIVCVLFGPRGFADGPTWLQFRGPNGSGVAATDHSLPATLDPEVNLIWKASVPPGQSSPIVVGDCAVLTAFEPGKLLTVCIDLRTGRQRWRRELAVEQFEKTYEHGPATATAASDGQRVFAAFGSFGVVAYDLEGNELWRKERNLVQNTFGSASSPVVIDGKLLILWGEQQQSLLQALDPADGTVLWERKQQGQASSWSTPVALQAGNQAAALIYEPFHLRCLSLETGEQLWAVPNLADEPITVPQIAGPLVLATSYNMGTNKEAIGLPTFEELLKECDADGDGAISREESNANESVLSRPDADGQGDHPLRIFFRMLDGNRDGQIASDEYPKLIAWLDGFKHANGFVALRPSGADSAPELAWQTESGVPECPTPVLWQERLFAVRNGGVVTCLDLSSGGILLRRRLAPGGPYYASPVAGDGKVYLASARGALTVLSADNEPEVISTTDLGEPVWATPALVGGTVLVRSEGQLWLFGEVEKQLPEQGTK